MLYKNILFVSLLSINVIPQFYSALTYNDVSILNNFLEEKNLIQYTSRINNLDVKLFPLSSSPSLYKLNREDSFTILQKDNSWATILYENKLGCIPVEYIKEILPKTNKYIINADVLNIREANYSKSNIISKLKKDTIVDVYYISNGWAKIKYNDGFGYIASKFISEYKDSNTLENVDSIVVGKQDLNDKLTSINTSSEYMIITDSINIRDNNSDDSNIIGHLKYGDIITVLDISDNWAKFSYNDKIAFINSSYICPLINSSQVNSHLVLVNKNNALLPSYEPDDLITVNVQCKSGIAQSAKQMRKEAAQSLEKMFADAQQENIKLILYSGYRSFSTQKDIYSYKVKTKGEYKANLVSAKAGLSEHQTGLAVDIVSNDYMTLDSGFANTKASEWLVKNASNYGFIVRYLKDKTDITGYSFEPWHFRYVGIEAAKEISSQNLTLEEYLQKK